MIKLIVSDIDGTLVPDGSHEMNPELLDVIMKIRENGVQFAAASGRQWASIESIFGPIKEKVFYLSDNGAYVGCHGRNLFLNPIDRETVMDMVRDVRRIGSCALDLCMVAAGRLDAYYEEDVQVWDWAAAALIAAEAGATVWLPTAPGAEYATASAPGIADGLRDALAGAGMDL